MIFHHMVRLLDSAEKPTGGPRNTHSTTIGTDSLLALVIGTSLGDLTFELRDDDRSQLVCVWPFRNDLIQWPARRSIDVAAADRNREYPF